jgi:class 3 adenylate cyclase
MKLPAAHLRLESEAAILVPLKRDFDNQTRHARIAVLEELTAACKRDRLQGAVVPVWVNADGTLGFLAEPKLHRVLKTVTVQRLRANLNRHIDVAAPSNDLLVVHGDVASMLATPSPPPRTYSTTRSDEGRAVTSSMSGIPWTSTPPSIPPASAYPSSSPPSAPVASPGPPGPASPTHHGFGASTTTSPGFALALAYGAPAAPAPTATTHSVRPTSMEGAPIEARSFTDARRGTRELPMRLVTMVFTDIVGSTELKQRAGEHRAMELIQWHHAVVREVLADSMSGEEVSTAGDSFFLVFASPSDAVRFALQLQARLRVGPGQGFIIYDRVGIHVGEVFMSNEVVAGKVRDFYGMQVDTCARVMSLGGADQILMTRFAHDNARHSLRGADLPGLNPLQWTAHGYYQVKGVDEPIEVFEVGEKGLAPMHLPSPDKHLRTS